MGADERLVRARSIAPVRRSRRKSRASTLLLLVLLLGTDGTGRRFAEAQPSRKACGSERVTVLGTPRAETLHGTDGDDVIAGMGGSDRILAGDGNDTVCGGPGNDVLRAGRGIDFLFPGPGNDRAFGGGDRINVLSYYRSSRPVVVNLRRGLVRGAGIDRIRGFHQVVGSRFDDLIAGDQGANALVGLNGDDRLVGIGGDDSLLGGRGDDDLVGGAGRDYAMFIDSLRPVAVDLQQEKANGEGDDRIATTENLFGSPHDDVLKGDASRNELIGGTDGDDETHGRGGNDVVLRYSGQGTVNGGRGAHDVVYYALAGTVDLAAGIAVGVDYSDSITAVEDVVAGSGRHTIIGDAADNKLLGGSGPDLIRAGPGADAIFGERGDDVLAGGDGSDTLDGGRGSDTCLEAETTNGCEGEDLKHSWTGRGPILVSKPPASDFRRLTRCRSWSCILRRLFLASAEDLVYDV